MNAALTTLVNQVYSLTTRPDLVAETTLAVKAATLKMHQVDYFPRDLFESGIQFSTSDYFQQLDYKALLPTYRSLKYLRKYDPTLSVQPDEYNLPLNIVTPENLLDSYQTLRKDVIYLAGQFLNIRTSQPFQYFILGCYLNPDISDTGYSSWIANDHPYAVIFEAARIVFKTIAFDEQSAAYEKLVQEQISELRAMNILAQGY